MGNSYKKCTAVDWGNIKILCILLSQLTKKIIKKLKRILHLWYSHKIVLKMTLLSGGPFHEGTQSIAGLDPFD